MSKATLLIVFVPLLLTFIGLFYFKKPANKSVIKINDVDFEFEIAKTSLQKAQGLSGRSSLCQNCGMIFIFGSEGVYPFWMKDTLIPLDIIWLDQNGKIITILTAKPEPNTSITRLKHYYNTSPAKYTIELNAGIAEKLKLKVGDSINLSTLSSQ